MMDAARFSPVIQERVQLHRRFWSGEGPSLLFIPRRALQLYDMTDYPHRFEDPAAMLEFEATRALDIADWPTDGIPTVRPSLGTIFIPASIGQSYEVRPGAMPWPGATLSRAEIREAAAAPGVPAVRQAPLIRRALQFYELAANIPGVYAYHADTQGVFDLAHLVYGTDLFTDLLSDEDRPWVSELMDLALEWFLQTTWILKEALGEPVTEMVHGHGTEQGLYFPDAGARISEDTATLLSPEMIERDLLPWMERSVVPFGGAFVHYCGKHDFLFRLLCEQQWCRAIDLGNPESYELDQLLEICARTGTVFHSRVAALEGEDWRAYVGRVGTAVAQSGARAVIRPLVFPETREECVEMLDAFHELTSVG